MSQRLFLRRVYQPTNLPGTASLNATLLGVKRAALTFRPLNVGRSYGTPQPKAPLVRQSAFGGGTIALIVGGCLLSGSILLYNKSQRAQKSFDLEKSVEIAQARDAHTMVGAISPGRPGNLTADQEAKLQELWKVTLKVFGVPPLGSESVNGSVNGASKGDGQEDATETDNSLSSDKKKSKVKGLFRRKKGDDKDTDSVHTGAADADDKYGQTKEFQHALTSQTPENLRKAFWSMVKHDHPDGLLLRFLRARKWDVEKALVMMISTMHWRSQEMHVDDDIVWNGEGAAAKDELSSTPAVKKEGHDFLEQLRLGKSFLHGTDKEGRPMCFVRVRLHHQGDQSEASLERYTVHIIETARLFLAPPVDTAAVVFDMTGFSMANMDYTPLKFMIKCFEANYPESLGVVLVHKSPWVFQGIWAIIKGWLDPVVASKVHFTKSTDELAQWVPRDHIPAELGGDDPWVFSYPEPLPNENAPMSDEATRTRLLEERAAVVRDFEELTQQWMGGNKEVKGRREALAEKLRMGYWVLDPYVRSRTIYDRVGMIGGGGRVDFYPKTGGTGGVGDPDGVD